MAAEGLARWFEADLEAIGNRLAFKRRLLERRSRAATVIIGTSRFNDGLDVGPGSFNASVPSSSLGYLRSAAEVALRRDDLMRLVVELSPSQVSALNEEIDALPEAPWGALALVRRRRALRVEQWSRAVALARPDAWDGTEFFRSRWLTESLARDVEAEPFEGPEVVCPEGLAAGSEVAQVYRGLAELARARGVELVVVVPPVDGALRATECESMRRLAREVADVSRAEVFLFACVSVPDELFNDGLHLTARGRARFTASVSRLRAGRCAP